MNISIYYFSGTGSTWWVVQQFKSIAEKRNHRVILTNIEHVAKIEGNIDEIDVLGFAYPIYGSDIPQIMKEFLDRFNSNVTVRVRIPVLVLTSMLYFSGDGALLPRKYLDKNMFKVLWSKNISLTSNISIPFFRVNAVSQEKLDKRMEKAKIALVKLIEDIELGKPRLRIQWGIFGWFLSWIQRIFERGMGFMIRFSADSERCIKCLKCVKECPTENIHYDKISEKILYGNNCTWCMRCYNRCPTQAVLVRGKYCDPERYVRLKSFSKDFEIILPNRL
ncbi:MAG: EFR1 family ferrodoxin [Candidatus Lokiarchaeota archaeon]|nr:EFR1 family ferrodoxin [Candidatus Lokiarchaeota archaeon]